MSKHVVKAQKDTLRGTGEIFVEVFRHSNIRKSKNDYRDHRFDAVKEGEVVSSKAVIEALKLMELGAFSLSHAA